LKVLPKKTSKKVFLLQNNEKERTSIWSKLTKWDILLVFRLVATMNMKI
jgi:hypothetical protein